MYCFQKEGRCKSQASQESPCYCKEAEEYGQVSQQNPFHSSHVDLGKFLPCSVAQREKEFKATTGKMLPGGCVMETLHRSSTGCHSDIEPSSRLSTDPSGFVQGIMHELVESKAK